jgi:UDP-N-acetyl-D-galactosamine dehydrogenase
MLSPEIVVTVSDLDDVGFPFVLEFGKKHLTLKERCPDTFNSKVAELVRELKYYGSEVFVDDPIADPVDA